MTDTENQTPSQAGQQSPHSDESSPAAGLPRHVPERRSRGRLNAPIAEGEDFFLPDTPNPTFEQLQKKAFGDKTYFLKILFTQQTAQIRITLPRRMGKTMLLKMVESFGRCEPSEQGKLIPPAAGSDRALLWEKTTIRGDNTSNRDMEYDKFFQKHFGQHPTIYFTMCDIEGVTLQEVLNQFRKQLAEACKNSDISTVFIRTCRTFEKEHFFLFAEALNKDYGPRQQSTPECLAYKFLDKALNGGEQFKEEDLSSSLRELAEHVKWFHGGKNCVLLLDEYDKPLTYSIGKAAAEADIKEIGNFHTKLLDSSFKQNAYVDYTILAGILQTGQGAESGLHFTECNLLSLRGAEYKEFFGLSRKDIAEMCEAILEQYKKPIPTNVQTLLWQWCNGYSYYNDSVHYDIANPYACCCFLNQFFRQKNNDLHTLLNDYLEIGTLVKKLKPHFKEPQIKSQIESILVRNEHDRAVHNITTRFINILSRGGSNSRRPKALTITADDLNRKFDLSDFQTLARALNGPSELDNNFVCLLMSYLCQIGVLTVRDNQLVVPNQQTRIQLFDLLMPYYKQLFAFDEKLSEDAAFDLQKILLTSGFKTAKFRGVFSDLKKSFSAFLAKSKMDYENEFASHVMFVYLSAKILNKLYFLPDVQKKYKQKDGTEEQLRIDLSFVLDKTVVIVEMKSDKSKSSVDDAVKEAIYYRKVYNQITIDDNVTFDRFIYIGIKVSNKGKKVEMCYRIEDGKQQQLDFITPSKIEDKNTKHRKESSANPIHPKKGTHYFEVK